jgi:hypothetical protein
MRIRAEDNEQLYSRSTTKQMTVCLGRSKSVIGSHPVIFGWVRLRTSTHLGGPLVSGRHSTTLLVRYRRIGTTEQVNLTSTLPRMDLERVGERTSSEGSRVSGSEAWILIVSESRITRIPTGGSGPGTSNDRSLRVRTL